MTPLQRSLRIDEDWTNEAHCLGLGDLFFAAPSEKNDLDQLRTEEAKGICAKCPVQKTCLDEALSNGDTHGIWGGMTYEERQVEAQSRGKVVSRLCGRGHRVPESGQCEACLTSWNKESRRRQLLRQKVSA